MLLRPNTPLHISVHGSVGPWLAGPEAWLDAPEGGCTDEQMDVQLDRQSPHSTGLCPLLEPLPPQKKKI